MNESFIKRKNRQVGIAECIIEGKSIKAAGEEYGISATTAKRDLIELYHDGYGIDQEQIKHNKKVALMALKIIEDRKR
ncbi:MAG: hypothetical protein ACLTKT_07980 [Clostridia bacterium]